MTPSSSWPRKRAPQAQNAGSNPAGVAISAPFVYRFSTGGFQPSKKGSIPLRGAICCIMPYENNSSNSQRQSRSLQHIFS